MTDYQFVVGYCLPYTVCLPFAKKTFENTKDLSELKTADEKIAELSSLATRIVQYFTKKSEEHKLDNFGVKMFVDSADVEKSYIFVFNTENIMGRSAEQITDPRFSLKVLDTTNDSFCRDIIMEVALTDYKLFSQLYVKHMVMVESLIPPAESK